MDGWMDGWVDGWMDGWMDGDTRTTTLWYLMEGWRYMDHHSLVFEYLPV